MNGLRLLITAAISATLMACEETPETTVQDAALESGFFAQLDSSKGIIPFPNNLLFSGTTDGTLEIPIPDLDTECPNGGEILLKTALNDLDGFSTTAPITAPFTSAIDTSTLVVGSNVRVFEVSLGGSGEVTGIIGELDATEVSLGVSSVDNEISGATNATTGELCDSEDIGANKLVISPLKPLKPKTNYLVALTNDIDGPYGLKAAASTTYAFAKSINPLLSAFPPTSLADANYSALTSTVDLDGDDVVDVDVNEDGVIDAADTVAVLTSLGQLEGLRQLTNASEGWIEAYTKTLDGGDLVTDLLATDIVMSWTFTTQSVGDVLTDVQGVAAGTAKASSLAGPVPSPLVAADVYAGTLTTDYYLNVATGVNDPAPLSGSWRGAGDTPLTKFNTTVDAGTATSVNIPLLASIPKTGSGPWPVVIYQHSITRNRTDMLAIADTMAGQGFAVVAIDMPLHGVTGNETDGTQAFYAGAGNERTFDLDLVNNSTSAAGADSVTDETGKHYINLTSLLTTRDNVRQSVADLYSLRKALETMTAGAHTFDDTNIYFVGHSLGAMVGSVFLATEPNVKSAVLAMPGGGIAKLLDGSAAFGPEISAGLAANGVNKGYAQYESFLASAQMAIDSGDPINYASAAVAGRGVLLFEVVGDGVDNLSDQVIPNNVFGIAGTVDAPLSGTDPLVTNMGLTHSLSTAAPDLALVVKYAAGHHGSILTPNDADGNADTLSASVTTEMQTEMATFIVTNGTAITISEDATIIVAPEVP